MATHQTVELNEFRALVQKKMCRSWDSPDDLESQVRRSLVKLKKSSPGIGWVRRDLVPDESATEEILGYADGLKDSNKRFLLLGPRGR